MTEEDDMVMQSFDPLETETEEDPIEDEESEFSLDEEGQMRGSVVEEEETDY